MYSRVITVTVPGRVPGVEPFRNHASGTAGTGRPGAVPTGCRRGVTPAHSEGAPRHAWRGRLVKVLTGVGFATMIVGAGTEDLRSLWVAFGGLALFVLGVALGAGRWSE